MIWLPIVYKHICFVCNCNLLLRQDELGLIEQKYDKSYQDIIRSVAEANIKNEAAKYTTVEYLSERAKVESYMHDAIRLKLGGDCCPSHDECIRLAMCHLCAEDQDKCNRGLHVDARYGSLLCRSHRVRG